MRSSAIQGVQNGSEKAARPPEGCPAEAGSLFGPESALGFDHLSGTNARQPSQKAGERWLFVVAPPTRHDLTQGQKPEGRLKWG